MQSTVERRRLRRQRTRLRPGKLFDRDGRFLADCQIFDRSAGGLRVRCGDGSALARATTLIDEREGRLLPVSLLWQRGVEAGLCLAGRPVALGRAQFLQAAGPYYRVERSAGALAPAAEDAWLPVGEHRREHRPANRDRFPESLMLWFKELERPSCVRRDEAAL